MRRKLSRILNLFVSLAWFASRSSGRALIRLLGGTPAGEGVVFCYHAVPARFAAGFAWQIETLRRHATPVRADHPGTVPRGMRWAAVTFDDGHCSVIENALPVLRRHQVPAAIFFITGLLGQAAPWSGSDGYGQDDRYLSPEQLARLPFDDLLLAGSHTATHPRVPALDDDGLCRELDEPRHTLEQLTAQPVTLFAFPFGALNQASVQAAAAAGYSRIFTVEPRAAFRREREFVTGRVVADPDDWKLEFFLKLHGAYSWRSIAFALRDRICKAHGNEEQLTVPDELSHSIEFRRG
jgi:peptidoglycan/xylan/chitin deacetylase (PgdA/CDA1 family)